MHTVVKQQGNEETASFLGIKHQGTLNKIVHTKNTLASSPAHELSHAIFESEMSQENMFSFISLWKCLKQCLHARRFSHISYKDLAHYCFNLTDTVDKRRGIYYFKKKSQCSNIIRTNVHPNPQSSICAIDAQQSDTSVK